MILNNKRPGELVLVAAAAMLMLLPTAGLASTAANTGITSTVSVNYTDAAGNAQAEETADVTIEVNLVAAAPLLTSPADDSANEGDDVVLTYTLTGTANGPDTYDTSAADSRSNMDGDATFSFSAASILLGGTTVAEAITTGDSSIVVPFDGDDADSSVNGLEAGDTIVIDPSGTPEVAVIDSIDESTGSAANTVTITLVGTVTGNFGYGVIIGERTDFTLTVTANDITSGASGTHSVTTTVTSQDDNSVTTSQGTATEISVSRPVLDVSKYVRNVTTAALNPGVADITVGTTDYYSAGVKGNPSDTMEYLIVIDNGAAGAGVAENIVVSNAIPQFTSLVTGSVELDDTGDGTFVTLDETADDSDAAEVVADTLYVYAGTGGDDSTDAGGTLQAGETSYVTFQVTID